MACLDYCCLLRNPGQPLPACRAVVPAVNWCNRRRRELLVWNICRRWDLTVRGFSISFFLSRGIGLTLFTRIGFCGVYYFVYMKVLPHFGGYKFRQTIISGSSGEASHKMVKVPNDELAKWDEEHDAAGRLRRRANASKPDQAGDA